MTNFGLQTIQMSGNISSTTEALSPAIVYIDIAIVQNIFNSSKKCFSVLVRQVLQSDKQFVHVQLFVTNTKTKYHLLVA